MADPSHADSGELLTRHILRVRCSDQKVLYAVFWQVFRLNNYLTF